MAAVEHVRRFPAFLKQSSRLCSPYDEQDYTMRDFSMKLSRHLCYSKLGDTYALP